MQTTHNATTGKRWVLLLLLTLAGAEFMVRGPLRLRHGTEWNDFLSPYIQSRAWTNGMNPYQAENLIKFWPAGKPMFTFVLRDTADGTLIAKRGVPSPYPVTTFALLAPLALLPWHVAQPLWILVSLGAVGFVICGLTAMAGVSWHDPKAWAFAALTLALAPVHTGLATENPAIVVVSLCVATLWAERRSREILAILFLTLAICLKPQVGVCVLLFYLVRRRWKLAGGTLAAVALVALVAVARLAAAGTPWLGSYLENSRNIFATGAINDFTPANAVWFHMVNLQVGLYPLLRNTTATNWCAVLIATGLVCAWSAIAFRSGRRLPPMLLLSTLLVASLLPVYHRAYDAALLVFPLGWLLLEEHQLKAASAVSLALVAPFLLPGGVFVTLVAEKSHLAASIANSWWWRSFFMAHEVWALMILAVWLLWAMKQRSTNPEFEKIRIEDVETLAVAR